MQHKHDSFNIVGKIAHFFASNKPLSILAFIGLISLGVFAFILTPKQYNPEIVRPAFSITLSYQGATPELATDKVVYELVEKISAVPGVDEILTEVKDGAMIGTTVIFDVGYDKTKAKVDLISQIQQHSYLAKGFITEPNIMEINPETIPVLQIVFSSESKSISDVRSEVVKISKKLTDIPEVSDASVVGGYKPSLIVQINPTLLKESKLTINDVANALKKGEMRIVTSGYDNGKINTNVIFDSRAKSASEIGNIYINNKTKIRDIASVYDGALPSRSYTFYETKENEPKEVVMLSVSKVEGSSAPVVTKKVKNKINEILEENKENKLSYNVVSDDGITATEEIQGLVINLIQSIGIVAVVLLLFLSVRAALIVLIAIPSTLLIVFAVGLLFDQTINRITLFALILSLGLLVDAAIVVVENIYVHLKKTSSETAKSVKNIIVAGSVNEIGAGLLLSTITSVIVFLPVKYITGMMGPYMGPIAFFVPAALIISLMVAITIIPFTASFLLKKEEKETGISVWVRKQMENLTYFYQKILSTIISKRKNQKTVLLTAVFLFLFVLIFPLTGMEHFQMLPKADRNQFYVYIDAPINSSTEKTKEISEEISNVILENKNVISVQRFVATPPIIDFNGMFKGAQYRNGKNQATLRVNLTHSKTRKESSTDIVTEIRHRLEKENFEYSRMTRLIEEPPGPPVMATLVAKISSNNPDTTKNAVRDLMSVIVNTKGVIDPHISYEKPTGNIKYVFDREQAKLLGISEFSIMPIISLYSGSLPVTEYISGKSPEFTPIVLTLGREHRDVPAKINEASVRNKNGKLISVSSVLDTSYEERKDSIYLERGKKLAYITGEVENRPIIYVVIDIMHSLIKGELKNYKVTNWNLFNLTLEKDTGKHIELAWDGEWKMTLENFRDLGMAMAVALMLVYATLVVQYRSFKKPGFIMVTVPLGLVGILTGFLLLDNFFGIYLTATALIGFIALIGIVVNNAIIFSEYVEQSVSGGMNFKDALVEAGGARFRPILLTSLTTILGSLTIVRDPVWSGLAWAIVFGLSLSTILTLIIYPTLLSFFNVNDKL